MRLNYLRSPSSRVRMARLARRVLRAPTSSRSASTPSGRTSSGGASLCVFCQLLHWQEGKWPYVHQGKTSRPDAPSGGPPLIALLISSAILTYSSSGPFTSCPVIICMITAVLDLHFEVSNLHSGKTGRQLTIASISSNLSDRAGYAARASLPHSLVSR